MCSLKIKVKMPVWVKRYWQTPAAYAASARVSSANKV